jgi:hypothetical protein
MWDVEGAGFIRVDYHSTTQQRLRVATNHVAAWLFAMSKEEGLSRFAESDIALPYMDVDVVRYFVFELSERARLVCQAIERSP